MQEFSPQTYDTIINLLSSAMAGLAVFLLGLFMGWLFWRDHGRRTLRRVGYEDILDDSKSAETTDYDLERQPEKD